MKRLNSTIMALLFAVLAFGTADSRAEGARPDKSGRELMAPVPGERSRGAWQATIDGTWLPQSDSSDAGGKVGISEAKIRFGRTFQVTPRLSLTPDITYSLFNVTAPETARLPDMLQSISAGLRGDYQVNQTLSFSALIAPGLAGDFKRISSDDIRARFGFTGRYISSERLTFLAGLIYQEGYRSLPVIPIIGAIYRPDEQWTISLVAPRPRVIYAPDKDLRLYLGGEMSGGEYQLHDARLGARVIRYRDFRAVGGADFTITGPLKGELAAGYAFAREFVFYDVFDAARRDINVNAGPFVRAGLRMEW